MRLVEVRADRVEKAVTIFLDLAYGGGKQRSPDLDLRADADPEQVLEAFHKEVSEAVPGQRTVRYSLRLGNRNYPFMKLTLQEHLLAGEYYFAVDTHDEMDIRPDFPDYDAWMAVRKFNLDLKRRIEEQFDAEGLDTAAAIRALVAARHREQVDGDRGTVLIVDDEEDLADCVDQLLAMRGFRTFKVHDGRRALTAAAELLPDLLVLDYELPEMDGLEVLNHLRREPATQGIPVLLASAGRVSLEDIAKADGFLAKPFQEGLLYEMVDRVLQARGHGK